MDGQDESQMDMEKDKLRLLVYQLKNKVKNLKNENSKQNHKLDLLEQKFNKKCQEAKKYKKAYKELKIA